MNIPLPILCIFLTAWLGLQSWTLVEIVNLKATVAGIQSRVTTANITQR